VINLFIYPGKFVGTAEEFSPCPGLYEENGKLYSMITGELEIDAKTHTARITFKTRVPKLQGAKVITLGQVASVLEQFAIVDLIPAKSKIFEFIPTSVSAVLHISNVKKEYVNKLSEEIRTGDIVRVAIIEASPHLIRLTTNGKNLGVVKAYCSKCRHELKKTNNKLSCPRCGSIETRKIAVDYGGVVG